MTSMDTVKVGGRIPAIREGDTLPPGIGHEVDVVVAVEGGQVAGQGVGSAPERDNVEPEVVLPVGRLARELLHVAAQDGVHITVRPHQHHFDGRRRLRAAIATAAATATTTTTTTTSE